MKVMIILLIALIALIQVGIGQNQGQITQAQQIAIQQYHQQGGFEPQHIPQPPVDNNPNCQGGGDCIGDRVKHYLKNPPDAWPCTKEAKKQGNCPCSATEKKQGLCPCYAAEQRQYPCPCSAAQCNGKR